MDKNSIIEKLGARHAGAFVTVNVKKTLGKGDVYAKLANEAGKIEKLTSFQVKLHAYATRKDIREAIEAGERETPTLPAFVDTVEKLENHLTFWHGKNGQVYLALPSANTEAKTKFFRNGKEVSKEEIAHFLCAKSGDKPKFYAPKLENIESVG
jgi:hypothetical protein